MPEQEKPAGVSTRTGVLIKEYIAADQMKSWRSTNDVFLPHLTQRENLLLPYYTENLEGFKAINQNGGN